MYFILLISKYFIVLASLFGIGSLVNYTLLKRVFQEQRCLYINLFINILFGYLLIASCTAIFSTQGITLQLLIFIILIFYLVRKRNKSKFSKQSQKIQIKRTDYIVVFVCFILSIAIIYFGNGSPNKSIDIDVYYDYYFYAHLSQSILQEGTENIFTLFSGYVPVSAANLYHYSDLWFTGFFALLFDVSEIEALLFINYPVLFFLSLTGGIGLIGQNVYNSPVLKLWIVIALFFGLSSYLPLTDFAVYKQAFFRYNGCLGCNHFNTKNIILIPVLIFAFYHLKKKSIFSFTLFLIIAMITYNTTIPGIIGGVLSLLLFAGFNQFRGEKFGFSRKEIKLGVLCLVVFIFILFLYLKFYTSKESLNVLAKETNFKSFTILFTEHVLSPWLIYWALGLKIMYLFLKKRVDTFLSYLLVFLVGLVLSATLFIVLNHNLGNVNQALSNIVFPLFLVLGIVVISAFNFKQKLAYALLVLFSLNATNNIFNKSKHNVITKPIVNSLYSNDFKSTVLEKFEAHSNCKWMTLGKNPSPTWHYSLVDIGQFILTFKDTHYPLDLSTTLRHDMPSWCEKGLNHLSPFCTKTELENNKEYILDFIRKKEINFLFVEDKKIIPTYLIPHINLEVTDSITKHQLYSFKW